MQYLSSAFNDQIILSKLKGNACVPGNEPINVYECHLLIFLLFLMEGGSYSHDVFAPIGNTCERESCITKEGYLTNERGWQMCDLILASFPKELPEFRVLLLELGPNQCCLFCFICGFIFYFNVCFTTLLPFRSKHLCFSKFCMIILVH